MHPAGFQWNFIPWGSAQSCLYRPCNQSHHLSARYQPALTRSGTKLLLPSTANKPSIPIRWDHPFPSQNANANENGRRIYMILYVSTCDVSPEILFWLPCCFGSVFHLLFHGDFWPTRTCLNGMVRQQSPKLRSGCAEVRSIKIIETSWNLTF